METDTMTLHLYEPDTRGTLTHRILSFNVGKSFACNLCNYECSRKSNLNQHIMSVHAKVKEFKCPVCSYECSKKTNLTGHVKAIHDKVKPYKCSRCTYECTAKGTLKKHVKSVHEKIKPFSCHLCTFRCSVNSDLIRHCRTVHEKLKPFKCHNCSYESGKKNDLMRHINSVHLKIRPHKCQFCSYESGEVKNLKRHIRLVHEKVNRLLPISDTNRDTSSLRKCGTAVCDANTGASEIKTKCQKEFEFIGIKEETNYDLPMNIKTEPAISDDFDIKREFCEASVLNIKTEPYTTHSVISDIGGNISED